MLSYIKGPLPSSMVEVGPKVVVLFCNDIGRWGHGAALAVAKKWPSVKNNYTLWYRGDSDLLSNSLEEVEVSGRMSLGESQITQVEPDTWVLSIVSQHGSGMGSGGRAPIRYDALRKGLTSVARWAGIHRASVHLSKISIVTSGCHWGNVESMLKSEVMARQIDVMVYD